MFNRPADKPYVRFLKRLHRHVLFDWYMEVGCRTGRSFAEVRSKTIAVDPFFRVERNVIHNKPALHIIQQTSDDFFESGFLKAMGVKLGYSFLDGMHLFEYLLRDFMNTEPFSDTKGVIALHDCCPYDHEMTTRDVENAPGEAWTGDVWKLIPILKQYRPDLTITVLGCKPTGLVLVSGLDPTDRTLAKAYDEIIADWTDVTLEDYGVGKFYDLFEYTPVEEIEGSDYALFDGVRLSDDQAIKPAYVSP
jgi:hypothetical protein